MVQQIPCQKMLCPKALRHKHLRTIRAADFSLSLYPIRVYIYVQVFMYKCSEDGAIPPNAVHDPPDTVQKYTLAHMLNKCSGVTVSSNQPPYRILHLNGHFFLSEVHAGVDDDSVLVDFQILTLTHKVFLHATESVAGRIPVGPSSFRVVPQLTIQLSNNPKAVDVLRLGERDVVVQVIQRLENHCRFSLVLSLLYLSAENSQHLEPYNVVR